MTFSTIMRLFVYGSLKKGGKLNHVMLRANATFITNLTISDYGLKMVYGDFMNFPIIFKNPKTFVSGELWEVPIDNIDIITKVEHGYKLTQIEDADLWVYYPMFDTNQLDDIDPDANGVCTFKV